MKQTVRLVDEEWEVCLFKRMNPKGKRKPKAGILFNLFMSSCSKYISFLHHGMVREKKQNQW